MLRTVDPSLQLNGEHFLKCFLDILFLIFRTLYEGLRSIFQMDHFFFESVFQVLIILWILILCPKYCLVNTPISGFLFRRLISLLLLLFSLFSFLASQKLFNFMRFQLSIVGLNSWSNRILLI